MVNTCLKGLFSALENVLIFTVMSRVFKTEIVFVFLLVVFSLSDVVCS